MKPTLATGGRLELYNAGDRDNLLKCQAPVEHQRVAGRSEVSWLNLIGPQHTPAVSHDHRRRQLPEQQPSTRLETDSPSKMVPF
jgi:hypothetical protein